MAELAVAPGADTAVAARRVEFPGRWLGGAAGVVATLLVAGLLAVTHVLVDDPRGVADTNLLNAAGVAALGVPVAFVLGRHYSPVARDGGWRTAAMTALSFALLAPPLGDLEIIVGASLAPWTFGSLDLGSVLAGGLLIGIVGLFVSFVVLPVTAAVSLVWIVLIRLLPREWPARVAMPTSVARFGVRHLAYVLLAWLAVTWTAWSMVRPLVVAHGFDLPGEPS